MKRICQIIGAVAIVLLLASCVKDDTGTEASGVPEKAIIVNTPEGAIGGEVMVKFRPEVTEQLDRACATRNAAGQITRSGMSTVDAALDVIGAYHIERIFPINKKEEQTRRSGLHLWYLVKFSEQTDLQQAALELAGLGELAKIEYSHELKRRDIPRPTPLNAQTLRTVQQLQTPGPFDDPNLAAQWHYINTGNTDFIPDSKAGADVNCAQAWTKCTGDPSIIVAVMDEGVMWAHPDLAANMWVNEGEIYKSPEDNDGNGYAGDVYGYNFAENTPAIIWNSDRDTGHGTHVAGTIAAVNNNGTGVCGIAGGSGQNDGVKIMSIQIFSGMYQANPYNEARGIKYAADNGAVILQCSWGYNSSLADPSSGMRGYATDEQWMAACPLEREAFDYFIHNAGSPNGVIDGGLVIFAAGNEYVAAAGYPGAYGDYICVAAMDASYTPASYTNYAKGVDITAPGGDSDYHRTTNGSVLSTLPPDASEGTYYGYMDGTSMACPHVSGVAALGLSYAAKLRKHFTAQQYRDLLLGSTRDLSPYLFGNKFYYKYYATAGKANPTLMELGKYYKGKMGSGLLDAGMLLAKVEQNGVTLEIPNIYVAVDQVQSFDLSRFFENAGNMTFMAEVENSEVALISIEGRTITVTGAKSGSTAYTVTASNGQTQTAYVTVRRKANDNGWF